MKLETIMPFVKIGAAILIGGAAGSATTTALQKPEQKPSVVECKCNCNHPPIRGELLFPKK